MSDVDLYDEGESFAAGDTPVADIDWEAVARLQHYIDGAAALDDPEDESMANLLILDGLYGDDLELL